jgi:peptidylprolyl isomerase
LVAQANEAAATKLQAQRNADIAKINAQYPNTLLTGSGIRYRITKEGSGVKPAAGKNVSVRYTGKLLSGAVFDSTDMKDRPIQFQAGTGKVIQGWDETILDMKIGEKRLVIIPPELAYGERGAGNGVIPPNSFLVFEMELIGVN